MIRRYRYSYGVALGSVTVIALFYLMQAFIHTDKSAFQEGPEGRLIDFVRLQEEADVQKKKNKPKKPPPPEEQPPDVPQPEFSADVSALGVSVSTMSFDGSMNIGLGAGFRNDGDYLPIVKVAPVYPRRALTRGLEGYVLLEFTVTHTGAVRDPVVIEADPPNVFERAAIRAALKFKYKPKVVNGEAIEVAGVRNLISFKLEEGN